MLEKVEQQVEEREPALMQSQQVSPYWTHLSSNEKASGWSELAVSASCLCQEHRGSAHKTPDLRAFQISQDESNVRRAAQQKTWTVVVNEQGFILHNKFVPVPWKTIYKLKFRKEWKDAIR